VTTDRPTSNVLTFGEWAPLVGSLSKKQTFRQLFVDGVALPHLLPEGPKYVNAPLPAPSFDAVSELTYLRSLLGGPPADPLRAGRIGLQFCADCLDSSDGILLAANLALDPETVSWRNLGFEAEHFGITEKKKVWWFVHRTVVVGPPDEWWTPEPFEPEVRFDFERDAYESAINAEISRLQGESTT
jgi:hypothetical protein